MSTLYTPDHYVKVRVLIERKTRDGKCLVAEDTFTIEGTHPDRLQELVSIVSCAVDLTRAARPTPRITPPPPVSADEMNRPFGPADGSGDWSKRNG